MASEPPPKTARQPSYGTLEDRPHLQKETGSHGHEDSSASNSRDDAASDIESTGEVQTGVKKIEAISRAWTKWSLIGAYLGYVLHVQRLVWNLMVEIWVTDEDRIFLMAFVTSLEGQTVWGLSVYATSSFSKHSLISTVLVVQGVVNGESYSQFRVL
jgi:hypothetical protein